MLTASYSQRHSRWAVLLILLGINTVRHVAGFSMIRSLPTIHHHRPSALRHPTVATTTLFEDTTSVEEPPSNRSPPNPWSYRLIASLQFLQVALAVWKSKKLSWPWLQITSGPLLVGIWSLLLAQAVGNKEESETMLSPSDITFGYLNGVLLLYASLGLSMSVVVPQFSKFFGWLRCVSNAILFGVCVNGMTYCPTTTSRFQRSVTILFGGLRTTIAFPKSNSSWFYTTLLAGIAPLKLHVLYHMMTSVSSKVQVASYLGSFARLSILGGTTVALKDAADRQVLSDRRIYGRLKIGVLYGLLVLAGRHFL